MQRRIVAIPESVRKVRMAENFAVFDFELSAEEIKAIVAFDSKTSSFFDHRDGSPAGLKLRAARASRMQLGAKSALDGSGSKRRATRVLRSGQ